MVELAKKSDAAVNAISWDMRDSTKWLPMKSAQPVTMTFLCMPALCKEFTVDIYV